MKIGTVNVHTSLLPRHRGAAPVQWTVWQGETVTGVTTMFTDAGIDTGDILLQRETPIGPEETAGELTERLSHLGGELLIETLAPHRGGRLPPAEAGRKPHDLRPQDHQGNGQRGLYGDHGPVREPGAGHEPVALRLCDHREWRAEDLEGPRRSGQRTARHGAGAPTGKRA